MHKISPLISPHAAPMQRRTALQGIAAIFATGVAPWVQASTFPNKPIQLVLPFPVGGSFDPTLRAFAQAVGKELGQPMVLMHQPGAGGVLGTANVAQMTKADGYTIGVMHNSVIRAPLVQRVNWHPLENFTYLASLYDMVTGIVVAHDAPWQTFKDVMAEAKQKPGQLSWGNVGAISINRITAQRLARLENTSFNMVSFKGASDAFQSLIGRHLDVYGDPGYGAQVQGGRVRLLATFTDDRMAKYGGKVPTVKEHGYDLAIDSPVGLVTPKGLPPEIAARLEAAFAKAAQDSVYLQQLELFDWLPKFTSGADYANYAKLQFARDQKMLDEIGFKLD